MAFSIVLARLLVPEDYGIMAMAATATGVAGVLCEGGFSALIKQRRELSQSLLSTIFWCQVALGLLASGLLLLLAGPTAQFYRDPALVPVLGVLAVMPAVGVVSGIPRALLARSLNFKRLVVIDISAMVVGGLVGVALAVGDAGVWALVLQLLVGAVFMGVGLFAAARWRPSATFSLHELREVSNFTGAIYAQQLLTFFVRNGDNMLVGRFLGAAQLAFYSRAYSLLLFPSRRVARVLGGTMQVALARVADDVQRCRRMYVEAAEMVTFLTAPAMLTLAVVMPELISVVLGPQWSGMVPAATLLCCLGAVEPLTTTTGWIFVARGRPGIGLKLALVAGPAWVVAVAVGVMLGSAATVAAGCVVFGVLFGPLYLAKAAALLETNLRHMVIALAPGYLCAFAASAAGLIAAVALRRSGAPDVVVLLLSSCVAVGALAAASSLVRPRAWFTVLSWLQTTRRRVGARLARSSRAARDSDG